MMLKVNMILCVYLNILYTYKYKHIILRTDPYIPGAYVYTHMCN